MGKDLFAPSRDRLVEGGLEEFLLCAAIVHHWTGAILLHKNVGGRRQPYQDQS